MNVKDFRVFFAGFKHLHIHLFWKQDSLQTIIYGLHLLSLRCDYWVKPFYVANFRYLFPSRFWTNTSVPPLSHFSWHRPPSGSIVSSDSQTGWRSVVALKVFLPRVRLTLRTHPQWGGTRATGWPVKVAVIQLQLQFCVVSVVRSPRLVLVWLSQNGLTFFSTIYFPNFYRI